MLELLNESRDTSLPVIVVKGKKNKLVGMVSAWDVLEKLVINVYAAEKDKLQDTCMEMDPEADPVKQ